MNYKDNIEWLKSLKQQIGQTQHRDLWHFEQVIDETIDNLKPLATPHGRLIDADRLLKVLSKNSIISKITYANGDSIEDIIRKAPTIIEAEVGNKWEK